METLGMKLWSFFHSVGHGLAIWLIKCQMTDERYGASQHAENLEMFQLHYQFTGYWKTITGDELAKTDLFVFFSTLLIFVLGELYSCRGLH